jgi:heme iron utilization protein
MEFYKMNENSKNALKLFSKESTGILSTHSNEIPGYPFGSVTPYCLDFNFNPIILVSEIAEHTKNMDRDSKVSLTLSESSLESEKQALGRFTYVADAERVKANSEDYMSVSKIYLRYFPAAKHYFKAHNFHFYRLNLVKGRYIEGFGKIYWITQEEWKNNNIFSSDQEMRILDHMNQDHGDSLVNYCRHLKGLNIDPKTNLDMIGIYQFGFDILHGKQKLHFMFDDEATDANSAREILVKMAKEAKLAIE